MCGGTWHLTCRVEQAHLPGILVVSVEVPEDQLVLKNQLSPPIMEKITTVFTATATTTAQAATAAAAERGEQEEEDFSRSAH